QPAPPDAHRRPLGSAASTQFAAHALETIGPERLDDPRCSRAPGRRARLVAEQFDHEDVVWRTAIVAPECVEDTPRAGSVRQKQKVAAPRFGIGRTKATHDFWRVELADPAFADAPHNTAHARRVPYGQLSRRKEGPDAARFDRSGSYGWLT